MRALFVETFHAGSHRMFADEFRSHSSHQVESTTLPVDRVLLNSDYHRSAFLTAIGSPARSNGAELPADCTDWCRRIEAKSAVVNLGVELTDNGSFFSCRPTGSLQRPPTDRRQAGTTRSLPRRAKSRH